jgi:hypothetical protein
MASSGKPKTTIGKIQREAARRERRIEKAARKQTRKLAQLDPNQGQGLEPETLDGGATASSSEQAPGAGL